MPASRNCLLARRLLERGVRFVQLFNGAYAMGEGVGNWDGHRTSRRSTTSTARSSIGPARLCCAT